MTYVSPYQNSPKPRPTEILSQIILSLLFYWLWTDVTMLLLVFKAFNEAAPCYKSGLLMITIL